MHNKKNKNKEKNLQIHYRECTTYSLLYSLLVTLKKSRKTNTKLSMLHSFFPFILSFIY